MSVKTKPFHPDYGIDGDFIVAFDEDNTTAKKIARRTEVVERLRNIDDGSIQVKLQFVDSDSTERISLFPRAVVFSKRESAAMLTVGIDCPDFILGVVQRVLRDSEAQAKTVTAHFTVGWATEGERLVYRHQEAIGGTSVYGGTLKLAPAGTLEGQRAWLREHVLGFAPQELAVAIGLAAPILGLLRRSVPQETMLFHLHHDTSKGKSTALRTMLSLGGSPDPLMEGKQSREGLMRGLNATDNALLAPLRGNHGLLVGYDETGGLPATDVTPIIYRIAEGKEKGRLTRDCDLRATDTWGTVVVTTGEFPLSSRMRRSTGSRIRLIEIGGVVWTQSPAHADAIRAAVVQHHGHIVPAFARHLLTLPEADIVAKWRDRQAWCLARLENDPFASRLADRYAVILTASDLAEEALGFPLDTEGRVWPLLLGANQATADQRDLAQGALEGLQEAVARNSHRFPVGGPVAAGREIWGRIEPQPNGTRTLLILLQNFAQLLRESGVEDAETVKELWRARGWLDCEAGKFTRKRRMVSGQPDIRVLVVPKWVTATAATDDAGMPPVDGRILVRGDN